MCHFRFSPFSVTTFSKLSTTGEISRGSLKKGFFDEQAASDLFSEALEPATASAFGESDGKPYGNLMDNFPNRNFQQGKADTFHDQARC